MFFQQFRLGLQKVPTKLPASAPWVEEGHHIFYGTVTWVGLFLKYFLDLMNLMVQKAKLIGLPQVCSRSNGSKSKQT